MIMEPMRMIKKYGFELIGALAGGISGFLYWNYIGCLSGACVIQSNPIMSTLYGVLLGFLAGGLLKDIAKGIRRKKEPHNPHT